MSQRMSEEGSMPRLLRLARRLWGRFLPERTREFILGDLEELHARSRSTDRGFVAGWRYVRGLASSVVAQRLGGGRGPGPERRIVRMTVSELSGDVGRALRSLSRQPRLVLVVALTLGIGVGSAGAVFGMVNQLLLRPLPGVADPGGTAYLEFGSDETSNLNPGVSGPVAEALIRSASLFEGIATYDYMAANASVDGGRPMEASAYTIFGPYFELLGVRPLLGRLLTAEETGPNADPSLAVISERLWERLFARSPDVVGRSFQANEETLTVIGVTSGGFAGATRAGGVDLWVPRSAFVTLGRFPRDRLWSPTSRLNQDFLARPRAGVSLDAAETQLDGVLAGLLAADPINAYLEDYRATLSPGLHVPPYQRPVVYRALALLGAAVLIVLLIACANVANLLLVHGLQVRGEIAVRRALGASPGRVGRQRVVESLILGAAGTLVGLAVAWSIAAMFRGASLQYSSTSFDGFTFDSRVLAFAGASVLMTTAIFGTLPAVLAGRFDLAHALHEASTRATQQFNNLRHAMSILQIALSLTLLIGGLLLVRTIRNLYSVDTGLATDGVTALTLSLGRDIPEGSALDALHRELAAAVRSVPGVQRVALHSWYGPYHGRSVGDILAADPSDPDAEPQRASMNWVSPGWLELFDVDLVAGRAFSARDWGATPLRLVVTAPLAQRLFGTTQVIGRRVRAGLGELEEAEIVGVVGEMRLYQLQTAPDETFFMSNPQRNLNNAVTILARTSTDAIGTDAAIRRAVEGVVPNLPVPQAEPLRRRIDEQLREQRLLARLLALLSGMAVLVAAVGLYGVVAFAVAGRKRELAIRQTLGADGRRIARLVVRSAAVIVASGIALGLGGALALSRVIESRLFDVNVIDLGSYAAAAALLACVAALACWAPARTAVRIDPIATLRGD